jgi:hypothetical protein
MVGAMLFWCPMRLLCHGQNIAVDGGLSAW